MQDINKILQLGYNQVIPKSGRVLLSEPFMNEQVFARSVILLIDHNDSGSFGLILNKPLQQNLSTLVNEIENFDDALFLGGPVEYDRLFYIFRGSYPISDAVEFMKGVYIGGNFENIQTLLRDNILQKEDIRFFVGYSGWEGGQLERELKENTWVVSTLSPEEIFTSPYDRLWEIGLEHAGGEYPKWRYLPESPEMN